jgi:hypothetical protein
MCYAVPDASSPRSSNSTSPAWKARAPPCEGWRTWRPPSASFASRPTEITCRPIASRRANGRPAAISPRVGLRFPDSCPGCVGTTFQSRTCLSSSSSASARWTIVAVASAGPLPVSCRSEVSGIPETPVPRYPGASPTTRRCVSARSSRYPRRRSHSRNARCPSAYWLKVDPMRVDASSATMALGDTMREA